MAPAAAANIIPSGPVAAESKAAIVATVAPIPAVISVVFKMLFCSESEISVVFIPSDNFYSYANVSSLVYKAFVKLSKLSRYCCNASSYSFQN